MVRVVVVVVVVVMVVVAVVVVVVLTVVVVLVLVPFLYGALRVTAVLALGRWSGTFFFWGVPQWMQLFVALFAVGLISAKNGKLHLVKRNRFPPF
jgi:hypothetical protein